VFQVDVAFTNNSSQTYVPFVDLNVIGVNSGTGMVKVINADNAQDGKSLATAALFGYSDKLGTDQQFAPAEVSGTRTFRFQDSTSELFTFDAVVTAYISGSGGGRGGVVTGSSTSGGSLTGGASGPTGLLSQVKAVVRFTANPLTKTVSTQIISLK
jgi:hypothetical protein